MISIGVVGAGRRTSALFRKIESEAPEPILPSVVFDPNARSLEHFRQEFQRDIPLKVAASPAAVVGDPDIQAVFIGSPNNTHASLAIEAFERKLPIFLEKPVAISREECRSLWQAYLQAGRPPVTVGFVLRYSPFFQKVFEIIQSGELGQLLCVDSDEQIGASTTALFWEGWRTRSAISGGLMVEKCSHDFDYLRKLVGAEAKQVFSVAKRSHLHAGQTARHQRFDQLAAERAKLAGAEVLSVSVYDVATDNPDHQAVQIEWANGVTSNFSVAFGQPRNSRRVRIMGSAGDLDGDAETGVISVRTLSDPKGEFREERHEITTDGTFHHGGDGVIRKAFWSMLAGQPDRLQAGLEDGIKSVLIALAAQESSRLNQPVQVDAWMDAIFGQAL